MKRILTLLAVLVALTGCRIEEAEYFDPTDNGHYLFEIINKSLSNKAACAARIMLFDRYYSAPEEERETLHDRYFYTSRIVRSGDEWHIIDSERELVIYTDGQSLSTAGATWRYAYTSQSYSEEEMPTIVCSRKEESDTLVYNLRPNDREQLSFTVFYTGGPQSNSMSYWCTLRFSGAGTCFLSGNRYGLQKIDYKIVESIRYESNKSQQFNTGILLLTTETNDDKLDVEATYTSDKYVWITCGSYKKQYSY